MRFALVAANVVTLAATLVVVVVVAACDGSTTTGGNEPCSKNTDCPGAELCLAGGFCGNPAGVSCKTDADCPDTFICLENGRCRADAQCETDADCCPGGAACDSTCVDFQCVGTACSAGDAEDCFVGCHRGQRTCNNGNFTLCDAAPVDAVETCGDGIDNDCQNGVDDGCAVCNLGDTQACDTPCGPGTQTCGADGIFGACDTPQGCICDPTVDTARTVPCGNCGFKDSSCGADGFWADDADCHSEGVCAPDSVDSVTCGACGQQTRTCQSDCTYGDFGACSVPLDACAAGETILQGCGTCGVQHANCDTNTCAFGAFGTCDESAGCTQGDVQTLSCGKCGTKTSTCDGNCTFGAFGSCQNEGVCSPGEVQTQACGNCGTQTRTCGDDCTFGIFGTCEDEGECTPDDVVTEPCGPTSTDGICAQGTQQKTCDANCRFEATGNCDGATFPGTEICGNGIDENCDGSDDQLPDQFEPNDDCNSAFPVTNPDGTEPDHVTLQPTFDSVEFDQDDYFFLNGIDTTGFSTEHVTATVTNIPFGEDLDLYLYKGAGACASDTPTESSENTGNADETVDYAEGIGNDTDQYFIRVHRFSGNSCFQPYTLIVSGLVVPP